MQYQWDTVGRRLSEHPLSKSWIRSRSDKSLHALNQTSEVQKISPVGRANQQVLWTSHGIM